MKTAEDGTPVRALIVDDEPLARAHLRSLLRDRGDVDVIGECGDGRSAIDQIRRLDPQLVLLDIQMPELDGLEVIREVGASEMPAVVFVTAYDEHALAAFEVHAFDYILKPVSRQRFTQAIDRVVGLIRADAPSTERPLEALIEAMRSERNSLDRIAVKADGRVVFVRVTEIDWIEADDDLVRIHAGKVVHAHRSTLTHLEERLPASKFLRVHRSTLVNVDRIKEIQPWFQGDWVLILTDGTRLHSGKSYRSKVREYIERLT
ncbi:MAG TPA: LytTR family DNA-binding domain-containing protein [Gemmatimonadaceae bacterium]|nr:LytTR family DNA-binding domain-containing protein [Gemmatimonadaceae bacterium]